MEQTSGEKTFGSTDNGSSGHGSEHTPEKSTRENQISLIRDGNDDVESSPPQPSLLEEDVFAWLQVVGAFCLNFNTWGLMNAYGVFQTFYQLDLLSYQSSSNISWIGSTQACLMFLTSILVGPIFDAGYLKSLLWTGSTLSILGMFLTSICKEFWQTFLAQGIMMGLGFGCLYLPAPAVVSQYFHKSTALAMSASSSGSAMGGVIYPIIFTQLQPRIGFGWATRVIAFIIMGTSIIPVAVMRSRTPPSTNRQLLDQSRLLDMTVFKDKAYMLMVLGLFFGFMGFYIVLYYIELYALQESSLSAVLASSLVVVINASSLAGRLILGYYADKVGSINVQTTVAITSVPLTFCLMAIHNSPGLVSYSVLYGFSAGAFMALPAASIVSLSSDMSKIGTRIGMVLAFVGCGVLVSNPIAGAILDRHGGWAGLIGWCGALLTASSISLATSRVLRVGWKLAKAI